MMPEEQPDTLDQEISHITQDPDILACLYANGDLLNVAEMGSSMEIICRVQTPLVLLSDYRDTVTKMTAMLKASQRREEEYRMSADIFRVDASGLHVLLNEMGSILRLCATELESGIESPGPSEAEHSLTARKLLLRIDSAMAQVDRQ